MMHKLPLVIFRGLESVSAACLLAALILPWLSPLGIVVAGPWLMALAASGLVAVLIGLFTLEIKLFSVIEMVLLALPSLLLVGYVLVTTVTHA